MESKAKKNEFKNFDMEKVLHVLIKLLGEQEGAEIEYTLESVEGDND